MKMQIKFEGGAALAETLRQLPQSQSRKLQTDALLDAAEPMLVVARRLAPRDEGKLADRIEATPSRRARDITYDEETAVVIGPLKRIAFWGFFQEWGTATQSAQPFLRPAFDENAQRSLSILRKRLWENIQGFLQMGGWSR